MPANDIRAWLRTLVTVRDDGLCQWCGKAIDTSGTKKRTKWQDFATGETKRGAIVIGDQSPVIDHMWAGMDDRLSGKVADILDERKLKVENLTLMHAACNAAKKALGDSPNSKQIAACDKVIDLDKVDERLSLLGWTGEEIRSLPRSAGRTAWREIAMMLGAQHLGKSAKRKKARKKK